MIEVHKLSKHYGSLIAVDHISFSVKAGEVLGFLGPNGAGKSTTMKMIAGFLSPTEGSVRVCGFDTASKPIKAKSCIGYLPEGVPAYGEMNPLQYLNFIADMRGLRGKTKASRLEAVIDRLHLKSVLDQSIETLSKGFKRRVGLAQAIIHDPKVLILDEPTDGLDPNQKHEVRSLINDMASAKIIVISTHILEEVHAVCNRAIIIAQGRILADATPAALEARSRYHNAVSLRVDNTAHAREAIASLSEVKSVEFDPLEERLTAFPRVGKQIFPVIVDLAREQQWEIKDIQLEAGRLDEVFREITTGVAA
jgi:ABC-type multidrug transport system, ATPase component